MIEINNLTTSKIDEEFVKGVVKRVLKDENGRAKIKIKNYAKRMDFK